MNANRALHLDRVNEIARARRLEAEAKREREDAWQRRIAPLLQSVADPVEDVDFPGCNA